MQCRGSMVHLLVKKGLLGLNNISISKNAALGQLDRMHSAVLYYNMWPVKVKISCLIH